MDPRQQRVLIFIGSIIAALLIVLIVVLLTGDDGSTVASDSTLSSSTTTSGDTSGVSAPGSTEAASSTSSSTTAAPTTMAAPATTAPPATLGPPPSAPGPCFGLPSATIPGPEPGVSFAFGDFDGDGAADQLIGYQDAADTWWLQIALSYGHASETAVFGPVTALGATDFGTGQDVGYAYVDSGASTQIVGFVYMPGCDLFEATVNGTALARFPVGAGVMHVDGVTCVADGIRTTSAITSDGTTWEYTTTDFTWVPGLGDFQTVASSIAVLTSPADDATIFAAAGFNCPLTPAP